MKTRTELTIEDIDTMLYDEGPGGRIHGGWGWNAGRDQLSERDRKRYDRWLIRWANAHDWTPDDLFEWLDSKHGRWFNDRFVDGSYHNLAELDEWANNGGGVHLMDPRTIR